MSDIKVIRPYNEWAEAYRTIISRLEEAEQFVHAHLTPPPGQNLWHVILDYAKSLAAENNELERRVASLRGTIQWQTDEIDYLTQTVEEAKSHLKSDADYYYDNESTSSNDSYKTFRKRPHLITNATTDAKQYYNFDDYDK